MEVCGDTLSQCHCVLSAGHEGPHACDPVKCGGAWDYNDDGEVHVVTFPLIGTGDLVEALDFLLNLPLGDT